MLTPTVTRWAGADRYATAVALSRAAGVPGGTVVVATGENHPDALTAGSLAGASGGVLLLTRRTRLPLEVSAELRRLRPSRVVVAGGPDVVSAAVLDAVAAAAGRPVQRVAGQDRYGTAAALARLVPGRRHEAFLVASDAFWDAAVAGAAAAHSRATVLLTRPDRLPSATLAALQEQDPATVTVVGPTGAVSDAVVSQLRWFTTATTVRRVTGPDRWSTAARVARTVWPGGSARTVVASGENFPDALAAAPVAAAAGGPLLLSRAGSTPSTTRAALSTHARVQVGVAGSEAVCRLDL